MITSTYGVPASRVQPSSMVPPHVHSLPTRLTILIVTSGMVMSSFDHKRFERFSFLALP